MTKKLKYFGDISKEYKVWDKSFIKRVLKFGLPMGISTIITSLMSVIDKIFIGQASALDGEIGEYALGATFISSWYYSLVVMMVFGFASMTSVITTQFFGAKKYKQVQQGVRFSLVFGLAIATIGVIIAWIASDQITSLLAATKSDSSMIMKAIKKYSSEYLRVMSLSIILAALNVHIVFFYKWNEKTTSILYATLFALGFNALFNYIFMFIAHMGVIGCAWSTILIEGMMIVYLLIRIRVGKGWQGRFNIFKTPFNFSKNVSKKILSKWLILVNQVTFTTLITVSTVLTSKIYLEGPTILGIVTPFQSFFMIAMAGILSSTGIFVGKSLGQDKLREAYANSIRIIIYAVVVALIGSILFMSLSPVIPLAFSAGRNNSDIAFQSMIVIWVVSITYVIWIWAQGYGQSLVAGGKTLYFSITSMGSATLDFVIVLIMFLLEPTFDYWIAFMIWKSTRLLRVGVSYYFYRKQTWIRNLVN